MSDEPALLAAVLDRPDDDTPRELYADWLDDHGQSERAEFIRFQCAPERRESFWSVRTGPRVVSLGFDGGPRAPVPSLPEGCEVVFARGFIEAVTCPAADWLQHADAILAAHPVRRVRLTDRYPMEMHSPNGERVTILDVCKYRWPRITFTLQPPARTHQYSHWAEAIDLQTRQLVARAAAPAELLDGPAGGNYAAARADLDAFRGD